MTRPALVTQWAVCGIAAAAARFVPVPMLDDVVRERALQLAVSRTLREHGRDYSSDLLEPLWDDTGSGGGMGRRLKAVGMRILLFPIRKYAAIFGAVRGVPNDVMRVVLVARTVDRRLAGGGLTDTGAVPDQARQIRRAVDTAIDGMDLRLLTAALSDGLSQGKELSGAAVAYARKLVRPGSDPDLKPGGAVGAGAQQVAEVLDRPDVAELLGDFDARVDRALA
jgi:hypothetical protein